MSKSEREKEQVVDSSKKESIKYRRKGMAGYDFYNIFEPMEFQNFARDMVQKRDRIWFSRQGPDLRRGTGYI